MDSHKVPEDFGNAARAGVVRLIAFTLSLLTLAITLARALADANSRVGIWVRAGIHFTPDKQIEFSWWLIAFCLTIVAALIIVSMILVHTRASNALPLPHTGDGLKLHEAEVLAARATESVGKARQCLQDMMFAASVIRSRQTPTSPHTVKTFDEVHIVYRIRKNLSTSVVATYKIRAALDDLHFWETSLTPSSLADPVDYLRDIDFKVVDPESGEPMTYLQTQNDPHRKSICVYFWPRLQRSDPARSIRVSYEWPGYLRQLRKEGREEFSLRYKTAESTRSVSVQILLEDGSGGRFNLEAISTYTNTLRPITEPGWQGWKYEAHSLPAILHEHKLSATWISA